MKTTKLGKRAFAFVTLLSAALSANVAAQPFCGNTINSDTTLSGDLLGCPFRGLRIGASGVTLDCDGHTIEAAGSRVLEVNSNLSDVTVKNCVLIGAANTDALRVNSGTTNILITGNDITTSGGTSANGIRTVGTSFSEISNNTVSTSGSSSRGFRLQVGSNNNVLSGNVIHTTGDGSSGVQLRGGSDGNTVIRNVLRTDNAQPVDFRSSSDNVVHENTLVSATG